MHKKLVLSALVLILALVNWSIYQKEEHIKNGKIVFLKLAPVDPRSLMQGDYMRLRFDMASKIYDKLPKYTERHSWRHNNIDAKDGRVLVTLDAKRVASFSSLYNGSLLKENELFLKYRVRNGAIKFATNAFFFEEGTGSKYEKAKYGEFRVNSEGELLLVALADKDVSVIK